MVNPRDIFEVHGATIGAGSKAELGMEINKSLRYAAGMQGRLKRTAMQLDHNLSSSVTKNQDEAPKYSIHPGAYHIGGGAISGDKAEGKVVVAKETSKKTEPVFSVGLDTLYSQAKDTILGSANIKTLENEVMSPLHKEMPSTNFTPLKGWMQSLLPSIPWLSLITITIVEVIVVEILKGIFKEKEDEEEVLSGLPDLGMIIIDNKVLEEEFLAKAGR